MSKPKRCMKCNTITDMFCRFTMTWSNGAYEFRVIPNKVSKCVLCHKCVDRLEGWLECK